MNPSRTLLLALMAGLLVAAESPFHVAAAQPPPGAAGEDQADALFREGNAAYDRGDFPAAVDKYAAAFALKKTHDIAANLGATELKLRRHAEAARHLAYALKNFPPSGDDKKRAGLKARYEEARAQVVAVSVTTEAGAEVTVGGVSLGIAPLAEEAFVTAGQDHVVQARLGDRVGTNKVRGGAGESAKVEVAIPAASAAAPPPVVPPTQPPEEESAGGLPLWPAFVGGGVALALAGVGIGFTVAANGASSDAETIRANLGTTPCPGDPRCDELVELGSDLDGHTNVAVGSFIGAGVLAAASVTYGLIAASSGKSQGGTAALRPGVAVLPLSGDSVWFAGSLGGSF